MKGICSIKNNDNVFSIIITFMLSLSELICENRQKCAHFESLICEKKFGTWRLCNYLLAQINYLCDHEYR